MRRGKEESRDYKVNFKFSETCDKAIKQYSCDTEGFTAGSFTHTTSILQCLNNHVDNGMVYMFHPIPYNRKFTRNKTFAIFMYCWPFMNIF